MPIILPDGGHYYDDSKRHELLAIPRTLRGLIPRREHPRYGPYGTVPGLVRFEDSGIKRVPRAEWYDRIEEAWAKRQWPMCHIRPPMREKNQDGTNFCWANGPSNALDIARMMAGGTYQESSAASVACILTNYRNVGGWGIDAIKYMAETGPCSVDLWPNAAIHRRYDTPKSRADRANHKIAEWIDVPPNDLEALVSCLLPPHCLPCAVGYDWWLHEVCAVALKNLSKTAIVGVIFNSWENIAWGYRNEHGIRGFGDLSESNFRADDCQAVRIVTPSK